MALTLTQLKQVIKEELTRVLEEESEKRDHSSEAKKSSVERLKKARAKFFRALSGDSLDKEEIKRIFPKIKNTDKGYLKTLYNTLDSKKDIADADGELNDVGKKLRDLVG
jgi:hypothetical protein